MTSINSVLMCRSFSVGHRDNPQDLKTFTLLQNHFQELLGLCGIYHISFSFISSVHFNKTLICKTNSFVLIPDTNSPHHFYETKWQLCMPYH